MSGAGIAKAKQPVPSMLVSELGLVSEVPGGVDRLRAAILGLAVSGRLGTSNPREPSAAAALNEFVVAPNRNIRARTTTTFLSSTGDGSGDGAWDVSSFARLPTNWVVRNLSELVSVLVDGSHNPPRDVGAGGIPMLSGQNIRDGSITLTASRFISEEDYRVETKRASVAPGDVLLCIVGSIGRSAVVPESIPRIALQRSAALIRTFLHPEYLSYFLRSPVARAYYSQHAKGTAQLGIYLGVLGRLRVPVPPLAEQKRIVAKLDQLMALCDELEAKQIKKREVGDRLTKAALAALTSAETPEEFKVAWKRVAANLSVLVDIPEAVTALRRALRVLAVTGRLAAPDPKEGSGSDLVTALRADLSAHDVEWHETDREAICSDAGYLVPAAWAWVRLRNLALFGPSNGFSPKAVEFKTPTKSLTLTATTSGRFDGQHSKYLDVKIAPDSPLWLEDGDLLIQRSNTIDYVGAAAIFRGPSKTFIHPDLMMKVRLSTQVEEDWIHTVLWAEPTRGYYRQRASGTAGSMPKINQSVVAGTPIPLPPRQEQRRILERMRALMAVCDDLEAGLKKRDVRAQQLAEALASSVATSSTSAAL